MLGAPTMSRTRTQYLDDGHREIAALFRGAAPGEFGPLPKFAPQALRLASIVGNSVDGPFVPHASDPFRAMTPAMGETVEELFAGVASHIPAEESRAYALLAEFYERFRDLALQQVAEQGGASLGPKQRAELLVDVLIRDYDDEAAGELGHLVPDDPDLPTPPVSVYALYMRRRYPLSARTPGGVNWPTGAAVVRDSRVDGFAPWKTAPGLW